VQIQKDTVSITKGDDSAHFPFGEEREENIRGQTEKTGIEVTDTN